MFVTSPCLLSDGSPLAMRKGGRFRRVKINVCNANMHKLHFRLMYATSFQHKAVQVADQNKPLQVHSSFLLCNISGIN